MSRRSRADSLSDAAMAAMTGSSDDDRLAQVEDELARLRSAMATAATALSGAAAPAGGDAEPSSNRSSPDTLGEKAYSAGTNAIRKCLRTGFQVTLAAAPNVLLVQLTALPPEVAPWLALMITPLVAYAQNALEDHGLVPALLRTPSVATTP